MNSSRARAGALVGGASLLERAIGYTMGSLNLVTADALPCPSPCRDWDLRALLEHMSDSLAALHEAAGIDPHPPGDHPPNGDAATVRDQARLLLGAWTETGGPAAVSVAGHPLPGDVVAGTGALEITVHGWDVARSCGRDRPIPPRLAGDLLRLAPLLITGADRPERFAPPVAVPARAGPGDRLVAFTGRAPATE